jgi:hypothetical protein
MDQEIMNPVGAATMDRKSAGAAQRKRRAKPVIGLLNNSKPNVAFFLQGIAREVRARPDSFEIVSVVKPRSAGPSPDIELLAARCDYVINAVAD